jgi:hypothetical protein
MALHSYQNLPQTATLEPVVTEPRPQLKKSRRWWLILSAAVLIVGLFTVREYNDRRNLREAAVQNERLAQQVKFEEVSLSNLSGWSRISGRIKNSSAYMLTGADLTVTIQDCVNNACETVGENSLTVNDLSVPSKQSREFERYLTFKGLPPPRGTFKWQFNVERLRGY